VTAPSILSRYRYLYCTLIVIASLQTLLAPQHAAGHAAVLAVAEIAGALLLIWRQTQWLGAWTLAVVFSYATVAALASAWTVRFVLYAASAFLIVALDRHLGPPSSAGQPR
jgi:hypothetical protein